MGKKLRKYVDKIADLEDQLAEVKRHVAATGCWVRSGRVVGPSSSCTKIGMWHLHTTNMKQHGVQVSMCLQS